MRVFRHYSTGGTGIVHLVLASLFLGLPAQGHPPGQCGLTLVNRLRGTGLVGLYAWTSLEEGKGAGLLDHVLEPDSVLTLSFPPGEYDILAFDGLGNSYGIREEIREGEADTLELDLEHLMYDMPNVDLGGFLLELDNRLQGVALERIEISREDGPDRFTADGIRIFPGWGIYLWLDRGTYSLSVTDQLGRVCMIDSVPVPRGGGPLQVGEEMMPGVGEPLGIAGEGSAVLLVENHLPYDRIESVEVIPDDGSAGEYVGNAGMEPGRSMAFALDPGGCTVIATDDAGTSYRAGVILEDGRACRLFVQYGYLVYDFGFPVED